VFDTVLVANRGEIACRIITTLHALGIRAVAVYSDADADARHVRLADVAVRIGAASAADSYLNIPRIVSAALDSGATAIHPGYGFLAENAAFAEACAAAGIVFIGPGIDALRVMGDKIRAKQQVASRGVPTVPGVADRAFSDGDLIASAADVGYPLLIKPSAGGGGKGMHLVESSDLLPDAIASARREALASFGDDTIFIERFVSTPRHIEVQILADAHGTTVHLGERECSLQRRHQKVIEEAPSVLLDERTRARIGEAACETARSVGYRGAGTVEFIVSADQPDEFFFMEMNTRLQVEHPVTEMVTGIDIVEWQLRIAAGEKLGFAQSDVHLTGHAIEARIYAEDPGNGFLPTGGRVVGLRLPEGDGIRVDSALVDDLVISADYDPMLAKVIAVASDRAGALAKLRGALRDTAVLGVPTNLEFLGLLLTDPEVEAGRLDTELIARRLPGLKFAEADDTLLARAALILLALDWPREPTSRWDVPDGWRLGQAAPSVFLLKVVGSAGAGTVSVAGTPAHSTLSVGGGAPMAGAVVVHGKSARIRLDGRSSSTPFARVGDSLTLFAEGRSWQIDSLAHSPRRGTDAATAPELRSPMPGSVVAIPVADGDVVAAGTAIVVVEAMKMEHVLRAADDGRVLLHVSVGSQVKSGEVLATVLPLDGLPDLIG
jgi:acetyl-CoA/propionyl-CoA carboxylase biotin carboxyl carrier protein